MKKTRLIAGLILLSAVLASCSSSATSTPTLMAVSPVLLDGEPQQDPTAGNQTNELEASIRKIAPYTIQTIEEVIDIGEPSVEIVHPDTVEAGGYSWMVAKTSDGTKKQQKKKYELTFDRSGSLLSKNEVPNSEEIIEAQPIVYSYGAKPQKDAYFYSSRVTSYGADCVGCSGGTSSGIKTSTSQVRQSDGSWKEGITYDGYYLIAASDALPLCTKVRISNHKFSGMGLVPGQDFEALVVDRGGAIKGDTLDMFVGSEGTPHVTNGRKKNVKVTIVSFGKLTKNGNGERMCKVN